MRRLLAALVLVTVTMTFVVAAPASAETFTVDAVNFEFVPGEIQIQPGDTVNWVNHDPAPHTVTADDGSWSYALDPNTGTASHTFTEEGVFPYFCKLHGGPGGEGMAGVVIVGDPPAPLRENLTAGDNVAAALEWSTLVFEDGGANFALLGRSDLFADSLASGGVQGALDAPLLLTARDSLDSRVSAELERLDVDTVYVLGGEAAISSSVASALTSAGYTVRRVAGSGRLETATAAADRFFPGATSAVIARGFGDAQDATRAFADSLGAGAYAAATGQPVVFSESDRLSDATKAYIESHPIENVLLVGGEAALSAQVATDLEALGVGVDRVAGADRAGTAAQLADRFEGDHEGPGGFTVVDGLNPNAWAAGFPAAAQQWPVVLSMGEVIPAPTIGTVIGAMDAGLVCAPFTPAVVCDRIPIAMSAFFEIPQYAAVLTGDEAGTGEPGTVANGYYLTNDPNSICYDLFGSGLAEAQAAHIHRASDNTVAIALNLEPGHEEGPVNCAFDVDSTLLEDILANPGNYYANVHTAEHPGGSHRGTLFEVTAFLLADMSGDFVPDGGDPNGVGFFFGVVDGANDRLCEGSLVFGLSSDPTAAHIHQDSDNAAVVTVQTPEQNAFPDIVCQDVDPALLDDLVANSANYYVNVHTPDFPGGAIRGELINLSAFFGF